MNGILMEDKEDTLPIVNLLRLFDIISVKRHKNMKYRDKGNIYVWHSLQFCVINKSHSSAIGMESNSVIPPAEELNPITSDILSEIPSDVC